MDRLARRLMVVISVPIRSGATVGALQIGWGKLSATLSGLAPVTKSDTIPEKKKCYTGMF